MKWLFLGFALLTIIPFASWLRRNSDRTSLPWVLIGALPFFVGGLGFNEDGGPLRSYMAVISWPMWPGYAKGLEVSLIDILALSLLLSLPPPRFSAPMKAAALLYFLTILISAIDAPAPMAVGFYMMQVARACLLFAVVARGCEDENVPIHIIKGAAVGLCYEAGLVLFQRFALGDLQPGGTFGHQNFLGLATHFVIYPWFALLLAGSRIWPSWIAPLAGLMIASLTASRATVGLTVVGLALTFLISASRQWTGRKAGVLLVGLAVAAAITPVALSSFERRFNVNPLTEDEYDERAAFEEAAAGMIADHPLGVGANNFVIVANTGGYYDEAGVAPVFHSRSAHVHNIYLLIAAETGWIGLFAAALLMFTPLVIAFRWGWYATRDGRGDLLLGLGISLLVVYVHSLFEWTLITHQLQFLLAIAVGLIVGLAQQVRYGSKLVEPVRTRQTAPRFDVLRPPRYQPRHRAAATDRLPGE